jgi:protein disulfide-isomerase A6
VGTDATQSEKLAQQFQIQGFPTIKVFGANKKAPTNYEGQRTASAIIDFGLKVCDGWCDRGIWPGARW